MKNERLFSLLDAVTGMDDPRLTRIQKLVEPVIIRILDEGDPMDILALASVMITTGALISKRLGLTEEMTKDAIEIVYRKDDERPRQDDA